MNKARKAARAAIAAVMIAALLLLTACGSGISGKWHSTSEKGTQLAFSSTGRVTMSAEGIELTGVYSEEGDRLVMQLDAPDGESYTISATYWIEDKKLYMQNDKGQTEIFER